MAKKLSVSKAYTRGWQILKARPLFFVTIMLLIIAVGTVGGSMLDIAISSLAHNEVTYLTIVVLLSAIFVTLVGELLKFGLKKIALRLVRGASADYEHLVVSYTRGVRYLVCAVLFNLLVIGLPLIILSTALSLTSTNFLAIAGTFTGSIVVAVVLGLGGFLALLFHLYPYVLLDNPTGIVQIFQDAWTLTDGARFDLVIFYAVALILNFFGMVLFGIGLLITIPLTIIAQTHAYHQLRKNTFSFDSAN